MKKENLPAKKMDRRKKYLWISGLTTVFVVCALILGNAVIGVLSDRYSLTLDLTADKAFMLTDKSKQYLENISQPVSIKVMESEENFISGGEYFVQANEVLHQYEKYSDKITLSYIDLLQNPSLAAEYQNVKMGDIIISSADRERTLNAYDLFEIESSYYGKYITASKAEQMMTSAIMGVVSPSEVKITVLGGHGEQEPQEFLNLLKNNNFEVNTVFPASEEIPEDTDVLLWTAPTADPDQEVLERIDQFLTEKPGRSLCYFADTTQSQLPRLEEFLKEWGIEVLPSSVVETDNQKIVNANPYFSTTTLESDQFTEKMSDPFVPMTMPFARPLNPAFEMNMERSTRVLFSSSDSSSLIPYDLSEEELENWKPQEYGPFPLAILSEQTFEDGGQSQVIGFGSTVSLSGSLMESSSFANSDYYLSLLNVLTQREDVISIESKTLGGKELGLNTMQAFVIGSIFMIALPIVVLCGGIYVWLKRRNA